jgi:hypothetical protein
LDGARIMVRRDQPRVIAPPLRGGIWVAGNGPSNDSYHRRALLALNGRVTIAQRFAYDFMKLGDDGKTIKGDRSQNENWYGYGADVFAVADGIVLEVQDGVSENVPLSPKPPVPIPTAKAVGGGVVTFSALVKACPRCSGIIAVSGGCPVSSTWPASRTRERLPSSLQEKDYAP